MDQIYKLNTSCLNLFLHIPDMTEIRKTQTEREQDKTYFRKSTLDRLLKTRVDQGTFELANTFDCEFVNNPIELPE